MSIKIIKLKEKLKQAKADEKTLRTAKNDLNKSFTAKPSKDAGKELKTATTAWVNAKVVIAELTEKLEAAS